MTITNTTNKTAGIQFKELCNCDAFLYGNKLYIKAIECFNEEGEAINAFCASTGLMEYFNERDVVVPVIANVECK